MPAVSIVMNCRNGARYLKEALDSVYAQTFSDWELVFWDNASTDASAEIARGYDARLRYFRSEDTLTLGAARNRALEQCQGRFIGFLDTDDAWMPSKIEKQARLFDDPEVGLVYANCLIFTDEGAQRLHYRSPRDYAVGRCFDELLARYFLAMPSVMLRREALGPRSEWVDESFSVAEEADLFLRVALRWKLAMVPEVLARYRIHAGSESRQRAERFLAEGLQILAKLRAAQPDFDRGHGEAARRFLDWARYSQALMRWRAGDSRGARDQLTLLSERSLRHTLFWMLSFVPYRLAAPALSRLGKL